MASVVTVSLGSHSVPLAAHGKTSDPIDILRESENPILAVEFFSPARKQHVLEYINAHSESEVAIFKRPTSHFRSCYYGENISRIVHHIGKSNAIIIADNHEYYNPSANPAEDRMGYANNAIGQWIGNLRFFNDWDNLNTIR